MPESPVSILLIDDHPLVRQGVAGALECTLACQCTEASGYEEAMQLIRQCAFDLAIVDISLGEQNGLDLVAPLIEHDTRVLIYSMFEDPATIERALHAGCLAYVSKRDAPADLLRGVTATLESHTFLSPLIQSVLANHSTPPLDPDRHVEKLSQREAQALDMLGKGWSKHEIADALAISVRTAETYLHRLRIKLGSSSLHELRKFAIEHTQGHSEP